MAITLKDMIDSGAARQICLYHARLTKPDKDWSITRLHAIRDFRDIPVEVINQLIEYCVQGTNAASGYMDGLGFPLGYIETITGVVKCQSETQAGNSSGK